MPLQSPAPRRLVTGSCRHHPRRLAAVLLLAALFAGVSDAAAQAPNPQAPSAPTLSREQKEAFLQTARIVKRRGVSTGVTGTTRVTLSDGALTHDASVQTIDVYQPVFTTQRETELDFRDSYRFNIAAYRLGLLLGIDTIPVTVERDFDGRNASFTWWVEDVIMDEAKRLAKKVEPPDPIDWNKQMSIVRVFDQLIYNTDRNLGNLLIDRSWTIWMIDHTRSFRRQDKLRSVSNLVRCEKRLLERLREIDAATVATGVGDSLTREEIAALLTRRDLIVQLFDKRGPAALFERTRPTPR